METCKAGGTIGWLSNCCSSLTKHCPNSAVLPLHQGLDQAPRALRCLVRLRYHAHTHTHKCWNAVDPSASCETSMSLLCCLPATTSTSTSSSTTPSPTPPVISDIRYRKVPVATTKVPLPGIWWPPGMPCSSRLEARGLARGMIKDHPNTFLNLKEGPAKNKTDTSWVSLLEDVFWFSMIMAWLERLDKNP